MLGHYAATVALKGVGKGREPPEVLGLASPTIRNLWLLTLASSYNRAIVLPMTKTSSAAKITAGMNLDTDAGPALVTNVARSQGGVFVAKNQIIVTFEIRGFERQIVCTPGQKLNVL